MRSALGCRVIATVIAIGAVAPIADASSAHATPPVEVHLEVATLFDEATVPFAASGAAVDQGLVCAHGEVTTTSNRTTAWQSQVGMNFKVDKHFECPDGSFDIRLQARLDRDGVTFQWAIIRGSGAYRGLHGAGSGTGGPPPDGVTADVYDIYDGKVG